MSINHRAEAERLLRQSLAVDADALTGIAGQATAHALLAIESRLGELLEQQRLMTLINADVTGAGDLGPMAREAVRLRIKHGLNPEL